MPTFTNNIVAGGHISLTSPLFTSSAESADPGDTYHYHVVLGGIGYLLDLKSGNYAHQSVQLLRAQGDDSQEPAEASINTDDFWRRGQSSWHLGAGQTWLDRPDSVRQRFRASKGVDIWTENAASLLNDTDAKATSANTNLKMVVAGSRLYYLDGAAVKFVTDPTAASWSATTVTDTGAGAKLDITSDGFNVWFTDGADVYTTNTGATAATVLETDDIDVLAYVKGRLMGAEDGEVFYYDGSNFVSLFTQPSGSAFTWTGFAEGRAAIYAAGYAGDKSLVYRIAVKPDGSALDQPIVAAELPDGEIVRGIGSYLGFVFLGTDKGVRYCEPDNQGNLTLGAPFGPTGTRCFEGQDRFIWFGWTNYDSTSTGLGRCSPRRFGVPEDFQPAYATDLMSPSGGTVQGTVLSVVTFNNKRYYSVSESGFYGQDTPLVPTGTLQTGRFSYGLPEPKVAVSIKTQFGPSFAGAYAAGFAADGSTTFDSIGGIDDTASDLTGAELTLSQASKRSFEIQHTLTRDSSPTTAGPTLTSWVVRSQPAPALTHRIVLPLLFADHLEVDGLSVIKVPQTELARIKTWHGTREVLTCIEGEILSSVMVDDFDWRPSHRTSDKRGWNGTCTTVLKVVA